MSNGNIFPQSLKVNKKERNKLTGHQSLLIWFTGLSGSGKSTLANRLEEMLHNDGILTYTLDGDNIRLGINKDLGFDEKDRNENIRRIGEVAKLMIDSGVVVLSSFISPFRKDRQTVRELLGEGEFIEVYVECPVEICETRDVKGLYEKARKGEIKNFTGIDSPYEVPENPEIKIDTSENSIEESAVKIYEHIKPMLK